MEKLKESIDSVEEGMVDTLTVFDEYREKFVEAIRQEKERVRQQALQESSDIIEQAEQKARQLYEKAIKNAEKESARILTKSGDLAKLIISEVDRYAKAVTELRQNTEKEIDAAKATLQEEAEVIAKTIRNGEKIIDDTKNKLQDEFEESNRVIIETKRKIEQFIIAAEGETEEDIISAIKTVDPPVVTKSAREETAVQTKVKVDDDSLEWDEDKLLAGTLLLDVSAKSAVQSKKFQQSLNKIHNLEVSLVDNSMEDITRITVFASRPMPLLKVLNEMASVTKVVADKGSIRVDLGTRDLWKA